MPKLPHAALINLVEDGPINVLPHVVIMDKQTDIDWSDKAKDDEGQMAWNQSYLEALCDWEANGTITKEEAADLAAIRQRMSSLSL